MYQHEKAGRLASGFKFVRAEENLTHAQARGYEQADIKHYDTLRPDERGQPIKAGDGNRQLSYSEDRVGERVEEFRKYERERAEHHARVAAMSGGKSGPK